MPLSNNQLQALKAFAAGDPLAQAYIDTADDQALANWFNAEAPGPVLAWREAVPASDLFEAMNITKFDSLSAGKRAAWELIMQYAPINFSRNKMRSGVEDIWGAADATNILIALTENATVAENALGGNLATNATVTALKRTWVGRLTAADASLVRVA